MKIKHKIWLVSTVAGLAIVGLMAVKAHVIAAAVIAVGAHRLGRIAQSEVDDKDKIIADLNEQLQTKTYKADAFDEMKGQLETLLSIQLFRLPAGDDRSVWGLVLDIVRDYVKAEKEHIETIAQRGQHLAHGTVLIKLSEVIAQLRERRTL